MRIEVITADITTCRVDAVVNAANSSLLGGGGVDGAIHRAAGARLLEACRHLRATSLPHGLAPGRAVATPGFDLPARWVIHTVGPNRHAGQDDPAVLQDCYANSLEVATALGARSVAFPAIGAGVYGWTPAESARAARRALVAGPPATTAAGTAPAGSTAQGEAAAGSATPRPAAGKATEGAPPRWPGIDLVQFVAFHEGVRRAFEEELRTLV